MNTSPHILRQQARVAAVLVLILMMMGLAGQHAQASVCAQVKIEIDQQLTFERQGFQATMTINNGLPGTSLTNLNVTVNFKDANGNAVQATSDPNNTTALFFLRLQDGNSIPATVNASSSATIKWLIIPAAGAGGLNPNGTRYAVGANLSYTAGSSQEQLDVSPDFIFVQPMPMLTLDYFIPGIVNGDDPFTPRIEPAEPFSLGIRLINSGYGTAKNLKIDSSQPKIIDNRRGLLVNFQIDGSSVDDQPAAPTLLLTFGDILGGQTHVGRWVMECSLYGRFVDFTATFSHADALGGRLTSLIKQVNTHLMLHDVLVDLPGRDKVLDFLAYRFSNGTDLRAYESNGTDTPVNDLSSTSALAGSGNTLQLNTTPVTGLLYIHLPDPNGGQKQLISVTRADGKVLNNSNSWLSKVYDPNAESYSYYFNLFDSGNDNGLSYNVHCTDLVYPNRPPKLLNPGDRVLQPDVNYSLLVLASDPDANSLTITASSLPDGATFTSLANGVSQLNWKPSATQEGNYPITFTASDGSLDDKVTITLTVSSLAPRNAWLKRYFGDVTDPSVIGWDATPMHDGLSNGVKYALNLDPTRSEDNAVTIGVEKNAQGDMVTTLTYVRRTDDPALQVSVVGSNSSRAASGDWQSQPQALDSDQSNVPDGMQRWKAVDSVPLSDSTPRRFLEVRASFNN